MFKLQIHLKHVVSKSYSKTNHKWHVGLRCSLPWMKTVSKISKILMPTCKNMVYLSILIYTCVCLDLSSVTFKPIFCAFAFTYNFAYVTGHGRFAIRTRILKASFGSEWQQEHCKTPTLLLGSESKLAGSLFFWPLKPPLNLINTELSWEEKVFTTPPLDNFKAVQVFLQWLEGMECWENNSTGNKADWFYLNFLYPIEAHFTCE